MLTRVQHLSISGADSYVCLLQASNMTLLNAKQGTSADNQLLGAVQRPLQHTTGGDRPMNEMDKCLVELG